MFTAVRRCGYVMFPLCFHSVLLCICGFLICDSLVTGAICTWANNIKSEYFINIYNIWCVSHSHQMQSIKSKNKQKQTEPVLRYNKYLLYVLLTKESHTAI